MASGNVGFFYFSGSEFSVLKFASIRTKPSQCVKEDQRNLNCKILLFRDDVVTPERGFSRIQGRPLAPKVASPLKANATTLLLKKLLPCLRPPPKLEERCVTTQGNAELESGTRKQGSKKKASFCLQKVQGLKDSATHPHINFPQVLHLSRR